METTYNPIKKEMVTTHRLGQAKERHGEGTGERILTISTYKYERDIITRAEVSLHTATGFQHAYGMVRDGEGDYSKRLQRVPCPRVSEKVIKAAHQSQAVWFQAILDEAIAWYARQEQGRAA